MTIRKPKESDPSPRWMQTVLRAAGVYNLVWGSWVVLRPEDLFVMTSIAPPRYLGIWQCVGMIVGVYGIGYLAAASSPLRHWPIVLVGLLGKIFGPLGFLSGLLSPQAEGALPVSWGITLITNDLVWWIPFTAILYQAFKQANAPAEQDVLGPAEANEQFRSQHGQTIAELSRRSDVFVLFLRHSGCTFCREALADLARQRQVLEAREVIPVLVHMGGNRSSGSFFARYGLEDLHRFSDPNCTLYRSYQLGRGRLGQLFGPAVWWRGFKASILAGHGIGKLKGDGFQLGGAFVVRDNRIVQSFRHQSSADRPSYCELTQAPTAAATGD